MKVSIIIPVYNTGEYLHKCIKSILNQSLKDIELIIVNDGSTDNSRSICDKYAKTDNRVKVIHKINGGVSRARNTGIKLAKGDYIGFVDSDDWVNETMYKSMYDTAIRERCDIVMCDARTVYDDKENEADTISQLMNSTSLSKKDIYPGVLAEMAGAAWRCIYKKELLQDNNILFPEGLKFSEDRIFNIYAFGYAEKIYYIKKAYYNRYIRKGSAVNKYYDNVIDIVLDGRKRIMDAIDAVWNGGEDYKREYENQIIGLTYSSINNVFYKESQQTFKEKYLEVKRICGKEEVRNAINLCGRNDIRANAIMHKNILFLCGLSIFLNKKYRR